MSHAREDEVARILGGYTDPIPAKLVEAFRAGKCVLFAGSGVSRRCLARNRKPLPTWQELLKVLLSMAKDKKLLSSDIAGELDRLIRRDEYLMVAQELLETLGIEAVQGLLSEAFDPDGIVPSRLHELLAITPFRFRVTTNYDNLLERAFVGIWNRHIERVCLDELKRLGSMMRRQTEFVLKLHGDLARPETIVLGQKQYQFLLQSREYSAVLDNIFKENSVLMLGYGLGDVDIQLTLDRIAQPSNPRQPHYLLCSRGSRTVTEKKRLAADRNVHIVEYVDHFGFHNHLDTFLKGLNIAIGNERSLIRIRPSLRARIAVHYPDNLTEDGLFVWNLLFREGAIIPSEKPQRDQMRHLGVSLAKHLETLDYLLFVVDEQALQRNGIFLPLVKKALSAASSRGVQAIFVVVGAEERPPLLAKGIFVPTFYVVNGFSEKDLTLLRSYIAQDIRMGHRQA